MTGLTICCPNGRCRLPITCTNTELSVLSSVLPSSRGTTTYIAEMVEPDALRNQLLPLLNCPSVAPEDRLEAATPAPEVATKTVRASPGMASRHLPAGTLFAASPAMLVR